MMMARDGKMNQVNSAERRKKEDDAKRRKAKKQEKKIKKRNENLIFTYNFLIIGII
jgi:hypothetical protein